MRILVNVASVLAIVLLVAFTPAGGGYKIGDEVADFSLPGVSGKAVSLHDYPSAKGFVVVFTCNHCPFAKLYWDRLNKLSQHYAPLGVPVLAISATDASKVPEDSFEEMKKGAKSGRYIFPYLYDSTQAVARAFNAIKTPHAFVVFMDHGKWKLKYSGAIDDNGAEPQKVTKHYVEDAVNALLAGKPVAVETTRTIGCAIKWKN